MPDLLEGLGLRGAAAGDEGDRRADVVHDLELLVAHLGRDEPEDADAPGTVAEQRRPCARAGARTSGPVMRASARKGRPPPAATDAANSARSLTRVMGPWAMG